MSGRLSLGMSFGVRISRRISSHPERKPPESLLDFIAAQEPMVTFDEFERQIRQKYSGAFQAAADLPALVNPFFTHSLEGPLHTVIRFMAKIVVNDFGGLVLLALYGYGTAGAKIARSMFEASVNAAYIRAHPALVDDYIDFHWITRKRFYEHLAKYSPDELHRVSAAQVQEMNDGFNRVESRFRNAKGDLLGSWCKTPFPQRAEEMGLGDIYRAFYGIASGIVHVDIRAMFAQADAASRDIDAAPSEKYVKETLVMGHSAVVRIISDFNEVANFGFDDRVQRIYEGFKKAWPGQSSV